MKDRNAGFQKPAWEWKERQVAQEDTDTRMLFWKNRIDVNYFYNAFCGNEPVEMKGKREIRSKAVGMGTWETEN